jgi:hypothetical protein
MPLEPYLFPRSLTVHGRLIPVYHVEDDCPTLRWMTVWYEVTPQNLYDILVQNTVQKIMVTQTDPIWIICVFGTFPNLEYDIYRISREGFTYFCCEYFRQKVDYQTINWQKEGF